MTNLGEEPTPWNGAFTSLPAPGTVVSVPNIGRFRHCAVGIAGIYMITKSGS